MIQKLRNQNKEMTDTVRFRNVILTTLSFLLKTLCLIRRSPTLNEINRSFLSSSSSFVVIYFVSKGLYLCQHGSVTFSHS